MKIFKTAVKAILVFDAAYLCFVCAEDVCSRIRSRMKKKNKTEPEPHFLDDEEEDTDYYLTPALCMDSLRLLHRGDVMDFIEERIVPKEKAVFQALTETEQEMTKLMHSPAIGNPVVEEYARQLREKGKHKGVIMNNVKGVSKKLESSNLNFQFRTDRLRL